jgi:hypothetical protein
LLSAKGKFHAVGYPGGLPGDGFDPNESVRENVTDGTLEGETAKFVGNEFQLVVDGKTLKVQDLTGTTFGNAAKSGTRKLNFRRSTEKPLCCSMAKMRRVGMKDE